MKIKVTQHDIDNADGQTNCPITRAIKRATHRKVIVLLSSFFVLRNGYWHRYVMPWSAAHFTSLYDHGHIVKPFEFTAHMETGGNIARMITASLNNYK